jgi:hypothetical protein
MPTTYQANQFTHNPDGSITLTEKPGALDNAMSIVSAVHTGLANAGAQIPTPLAAMATVGASPALYQSGIALATAFVMHDPIGIITNGIPLAAGLVAAGYAILNKTQRPTDEQISTYISALNRDELIRMLDHDTGTAIGPAYASAVIPKAGV